MTPAAQQKQHRQRASRERWDRSIAAGVVPSRRPSFVSEADWFWLRVDKTAGDDGCWPWTRATAGGGYGECWFHLPDGTVETVASRAAYFLANGQPPQPGLFVRHTCDNKPCCNPAHLVEGTQLENVRDCIERGRKVPVVGLKGEANPQAKLSCAAVAQIKRDLAAGAPKTVLAARHGISTSVISHIDKGRSWREVKP